jgi:hypothetical protein
MALKRVMQFGGITLIAIARVLMARTGSVALVLGAAPVAGVPFWFQLSFMRLFATALLLAGVFVPLALVCGVSSAVVSPRRA